MPNADFSALTRPVPAEEVRRFRQWATSSGWIDSARPPISVAQVVVFVVVGAVALSVFAGFFSTIGSLLLGGSGQASSLLTLLVPLAVIALGVGIAVAAWRTHTGTRATWEKRLRLREFAEARGCTYTGHLPAPGYPGMIFDIGSDRMAFDSVRSTTGRALDIGGYRYTVKQGKNSTTYRWGYVALRLDRRLPHMVLDATSNNLFGSNLPRRFGRDSALSLEGDFDRYFTLYAPPDYGRDALYVFTPDLMALLIDETSAFDIEIVDNWMFVYATRPFDLLDPAVWRRLDRIVETVGTKTLSQTERYADERILHPRLDIVAPQGRRMTRGMSPGGMVMTLVGVTWVVFTIARAGA